MRMGDRERSVNVTAKRAPCRITYPGGANRERACLLLWGQLELIADQLGGDAQVVMFVALFLEGVLHLAELLLQATTLHHLRPKLVIETCPSHVPTVSKGLPQILGRKTTREIRDLPSTYALSLRTSSHC